MKTLLVLVPKFSYNDLRAIRGWVGASGFYTRNLLDGKPFWNVEYSQTIPKYRGLENLDLVLCPGFVAWKEIEALESLGLDPKAFRIPHPSDKQPQEVIETTIKVLWEIREKIDGIEKHEGLSKF